LLQLKGCLCHWPSQYIYELWIWKLLNQHESCSLAQWCRPSLKYNHLFQCVLRNIHLRCPQWNRNLSWSNWSIPYSLQLLDWNRRRCWAFVSLQTWKRFQHELVISYIWLQLGSKYQFAIHFRWKCDCNCQCEWKRFNSISIGIS
jgi:hypothetical protein